MLRLTCTHTCLSSLFAHHLVHLSLVSFCLRAQLPLCALHFAVRSQPKALGSSGAMASTSRALAPFGRTSQLALFSRVASRTYSTTARNHALRSAARPTAAVSKLGPSTRVAFRRAYANQAPKPKPSRLRRTFRWAWRLTYLSAAGLVGYTFYIVYQDRHPEPQFEPDPTKKTLVILGKRNRSHHNPKFLHLPCFVLTLLSLFRNWLGLSCPSQKAGY